MSIRYLDKDFAITSQVSPESLPELRDAGLATIICNRPDGEATDQPAFAAVAEQAAACDVQAHYLPVVPGKITPSEVVAFAALYANASKPVLAYCRTGLRAEALWQLSAPFRRLG
ncbi:TIGR01244 family sulfur transferase [Massilia jejuensis]|uniref:TIGR01244 family sulfur transferase n=1 Tax=Massilia jejuensis TaxID=648894 RepID=A0ABW0PH14_9BURK